MDNDKIGKFISDLRKNNNLTQQAFADKLGVTYQAVSKWENGKSIPDIIILKEISKQFNVSIDELLQGEKNIVKKKNYLKYIVIGIIILLIFILFFVIINDSGHYEFKGLYTNNNEFSIDGVMAFCKDKSSIYISNINYNKDDKEEYKVLECNLYQKNGNMETMISTCGNLDDNSNITTNLNDLLKKVSFKIDHYNNRWNDLTKSDLYIEINARNKNNKIITYDIPLKLEDSCN